MLVRYRLLFIQLFKVCAYEKSSDINFIDRQAGSIKSRGGQVITTWL